ncbi:unnamed protein product [Schistosoma margrebowiei]|uniref:Uncharacterized protein n=1 Tax=Schistosoma margrebowiei TaxID=48269 RepID=A0A183LKM1_9TREM|nr:unnamed protein product [Schistosoma margrebowiei]
MCFVFRKSSMKPKGTCLTRIFILDTSECGDLQSNDIYLKGLLNVLPLLLIPKAPWVSISINFCSAEVLLFSAVIKIMLRIIRRGKRIPPRNEEKVDLD